MNKNERQNIFASISSAFGDLSSSNYLYSWFSDDFNCEWCLSDKESLFHWIQASIDDVHAFFFSHILQVNIKFTLVSRVSITLLVKNSAYPWAALVN